jgi:hypothetical protein
VVASLQDHVGRYLLFEADVLMCWLAHNFNSQNVSTVVINFKNKHPRERCCNSGEDNIKMDLGQVECVNCGPVAQERDNKILVSEGMNNVLMS